MPVSISQAFIENFTDNVRHLAQQGEARLRPHVYEVPANGEAYNFERLAPTVAVNKTGFRVPTPVVNPGWSRRVAQPLTRHWADTIENEDKVKMLVDPENAYAMNGGMAMKRAIDDIIIDALEGDALDGDGGQNALPAGQVVPVNSEGMTLEKILDANEILQTSDIDPDEPRCAVVGPKQVNDMLNIEKITSADYQTVRALSANGMVPNFLGYTWIMSNRLTAVTTTRQCLFFTKRALGLAVNNDIFVRIAERPDLSHLIQVYLEFTMGAVRIEDEHVVRVDCSEA